MSAVPLETLFVGGHSGARRSPKLLFDIEKDETLTRICQRYRKSGRIIGKGRRIVKNVAHAKSQGKTIEPSVLPNDSTRRHERLFPAFAVDHRLAVTLCG
jgi:hypothetical protein